VKRLVGSLVERIGSAEATQQGLQEQVKRNSQNSSQPPSQDAPKGFKANPKKKSGKAGGGQAGHEGHSQALYSPEQLLSELFKIQISVESVGRLRQEMSDAVAAPVEAAHHYVQQQAVVGMDETSLPQGNADGKNAQGKRGWLWVMVTPLVCYFQVALSRSQATVQALLGTDFAGILNSDRYSGYTWFNLQGRQLCWAHLKRDFTKIAERSGVSEALGQALLKQQERLFELWHRVRDGTLERCQFIWQKPVEPSVKVYLRLLYFTFL